MPYSNCKVYFDGSHYIAIPHTERPAKKRSVRIDEEIDVMHANIKSECQEVETDELPFPVEKEEVKNDAELTVNDNDGGNEAFDKPPRQETNKEMFERLYAENINMKRNERKSFILKEMLPYFKDRKAAKLYVDR